MTIHELKRTLYLRVAECESNPGKVPALLAILLRGLAAELDHLESDPLMCRKCGDVVFPENVYADDLTWSCENCGALHDVKTIRTCELAPEPEEDDG